MVKECPGSTGVFQWLSTTTPRPSALDHVRQKGLQWTTWQWRGPEPSFRRKMCFFMVRGIWPPLLCSTMASLWLWNFMHSIQQALIRLWKLWATRGSMCRSKYWTPARLTRPEAASVWRGAGSCAWVSPMLWAIWTPASCDTEAVPSQLIRQRLNQSWLVPS